MCIPGRRIPIDVTSGMRIERKSRVGIPEDWDARRGTTRAGHTWCAYTYTGDKCRWSGGHTVRGAVAVTCGGGRGARVSIRGHIWYTAPPFTPPRCAVRGPALPSVVEEIGSRRSGGPLLISLALFLSAFFHCPFSLCLFPRVSLRSVRRQRREARKLRLVK